MGASLSQIAVSTWAPKHIAQPVQTIKATPPFRFFDLPAEIRLIIYEEVLVVGKVFYTPNEYDVWNGKRCRGHKLYHKPQLQLFRVSKQIQAEAEQIYLSKNLFVLPINWYKCHPFVELRGFRIHDISADVRHLFSTAAFNYVKNISLAIDQKLCKSWSMTFDRWKYDELVYRSAPFTQLTERYRFKNIHDIKLDMVLEYWRDMLRYMDYFKSRPNYMEMDFTNAFCTIGCCRPIHAAMTDWIHKPQHLDVIGLQTPEERNEFADWAMDETELSFRELKERCGLRFRKIEESTPWDRWMMEGELENESKHYVW
jgi:hypothetical protein